MQKHSAKGGEAFINARHPNEVLEVFSAINAVDATECLRKVSQEKTMMNALLYSPESLNRAIKGNLHAQGWGASKRTGKREFSEPRIYFEKRRYREMDGIKNNVGLEVQFGKYVFMGYDIFSKMLIFKNKGL